MGFDFDILLHVIVDERMVRLIKLERARRVKSVAGVLTRNTGK